MKWAALIAWVITAGGGFVLFARWLQGGGMRQGDRPDRLIRPPLILGHLLLAATGLVLWIVYLASDSDVLAWISFALLVVVALLGFTMLAIWLQQRKELAGAAVAASEGGAGTASVGEPEPAERRFPIPIVAAHGLLAATTVVLVLLAAAGVGD